MKRRKRSAPSAEATINLTSLMDITFVLLIAFMIVAPAVRYDVPLELPTVGDSSTVESKKEITLQLTWNKSTEEASLYLNGKTIAIDGFIDDLRALSNGSNKPPVSFEADRSVPWQEVVHVINELKSSGFENLILITEKGA